MRIHPFGAVSSKSCIIFALHQIAYDNRDKYGKEAVEALLNDFYVDDLLKSLDKVPETIDLVSNVDSMCSE